MTTHCERPHLQQHILRGTNYSEATRPTPWTSTHIHRQHINNHILRGNTSTRTYWQAMRPDSYTSTHIPRQYIWPHTLKGHTFWGATRPDPNTSTHIQRQHINHRILRRNIWDNAKREAMRPDPETSTTRRTREEALNIWGRKTSSTWKKTKRHTNWEATRMTAQIERQCDLT